MNLSTSTQTQTFNIYPYGTSFGATSAMETRIRQRLIANSSSHLPHKIGGLETRAKLIYSGANIQTNSTTGARMNLKGLNAFVGMPPFGLFYIQVAQKDQNHFCRNMQVTGEGQHQEKHT